MRKIIFILVVVFLLIGVGIQYVGLSRVREKLQVEDVGDIIPKSIPGWLVEDKPIADTPNLNRIVQGVLNFDSAVFRSYRKGPLEISIYIAYWLPGKVHYENVDTHTPDICWVANGWSMEKKTALPSQFINGVPVEIPNNRVFIYNGKELSVIYWHLSGKTLISSMSVDESLISPWERVAKRINNFRESIFGVPQQQIFIRISSNEDIALLLYEAPVRSCLELIAQIQKGRLFYQNKHN